MSDLMKKARDCEIFLRLSETGKHPGIVNDDRFRAWRKAAYDDPGFLYGGDYISCYEECRDRDVNELTNEQVRGCITFLLRQMRNQYAPYPCLVSGQLHSLLLRWIGLNEKGNIPGCGKRRQERI